MLEQWYDGDPFTLECKMSSWGITDGIPLLEKSTTIECNSANCKHFKQHADSFDFNTSYGLMRDGIFVIILTIIYLFGWDDNGTKKKNTVASA